MMVMYKMQWLVLLLLVQIARSIAANSCCPDRNVFISIENRCVRHENTSLANLPLNCTEFNTSFTHISYFNKRPGEDTMFIGHNIRYIIPPEKYCLTTLVDDENDTEKEGTQVAILCFPEEYDSIEFSPEIMLYICCIFVSAIMLAITFIVYLFVPELRELQDRCLMFTCLCLCIAHVSVGLSILQLFNVPGEYCLYQEIFTYFWMIACFFWLNIVSFNVCRSTMFQKFPFTEKQLLVCYCTFGLGVPSLLIASIVTHNPPQSELDFMTSCWFQGSINTLYFFVLPVLVLLSLNVLFFICTGCKLCLGTDHSQSPYKIRSVKYKFLMYLKLFLLSGLPWVVRVISQFFHGSVIFMIVMNLMVFLQGFFIFLVLVLLRKRALRGMLKRFPCTRKYCPESWIAGEDHEDSEQILPEEVELANAT